MPEGKNMSFEDRDTCLEYRSTFITLASGYASVTVSDKKITYCTIIFEILLSLPDSLEGKVSGSSSEITLLNGTWVVSVAQRKKNTSIIIKSKVCQCFLLLIKFYWNTATPIHLSMACVDFLLQWQS